MLKRIEKLGKRGIACAIKPLLPGEPSLSAPPPLSDINNVLVIRHDNKLGNLLLITPFLRSLRSALPQADITLLISEAFPGVFEGNDDINRVVLYHKRNLKRYPWRSAGFLRELREAGYDLAVDLSHPHSFSFTSALLAVLSGAPFRLGFERGDAENYLNLTVSMPEGRLHESDIFLRLLERLGLGSAPGPLRYKVLPPETTQAGKELERFGRLGDEPLIGIFTGGRGVKKIANSKLIEIAAKLDTRLPGKVIFFTGPLESGSPSRLEEASKGSWIIAPQLPLRQFAALLSCVSVLVTPDSGPMHLASAIGIPIVAIFRENSSWRYGPREDHDTILTYPDEVDCYEVCKAVSVTLAKGAETRKGNSSNETITQDN
jgi:heptosyltransferase-3